MVFKKTKLEGAYVIDIEPIKDKRGFFARNFCKEEFRKNGLEFNIVQSNISYNKKNGIIRGMHYQAPPHEEAKLVTCIKGALYDVIIDLRPSSLTYGKWFSIQLTESNCRILYIPKGCAHGFQTLKDDTVILHHMSEFYHPECVRSVRWDDPVFNIKWPLKNITISDKDRRYPSFLKL